MQEGQVSTESTEAQVSAGSTNWDWKQDSHLYEMPDEREQKTLQTGLNATLLEELSDDNYTYRLRIKKRM